MWEDHVLMQVKFEGKTSKLLLAAASALEAAKKEKNKHQKAEDNAKKVIARILLEERQINIDGLPDKTVLIVTCEGKDAIEVKRKGSQRFDSTAFALLHPDLQEEFTKSTPATYYDSLLPT